MSFTEENKQREKLEDQVLQEYLQKKDALEMAKDQVRIRHAHVHTHTHTHTHTYARTHAHTLCFVAEVHAACPSSSDPELAPPRGEQESGCLQSVHG